MSVMVSYAMADAAKDRIVCKATCRVGYMSALRWWSSKSIYIQTVALVSNKSKDNKKCLCIIIGDRNDPKLGLHPDENFLNLWIIYLATGVGSSASAKSEGTIDQDKNEGCYGQKRWFGMEIVIC
ncbi:hypothetical protein SO802_008080 [Lithocarpus litseifolius]|uniref:Uncharacterized protein n=1 Tax=Lithocarpus litseifolius TaxID=425828 RepID=A0AAW2DAA3_9ROSI